MIGGRWVSLDTAKQIWEEVTEMRLVVCDGPIFQQVAARRGLTLEQVERIFITVAIEKERAENAWKWAADLGKYLAREARAAVWREAA